MFAKGRSANGSRVEIDARDEAVQSFRPPNALQRYEGIAFSPSGNVIGIAAPEDNSVFLFRRKANGQFEESPYASFSGNAAGPNYPHDVAFSQWEGREVLAVANRGGAIVICEKDRAVENDRFDSVFEISGPKSKLNYSDGVAFVPPDNEYLAACNLLNDSISFYRRTSFAPIAFKVEPDFELKSRHLRHPDGLGFSRSGEWLAVANHANHSVSIFRRRSGIFSRGKLKYGSWPVTVIKDPGLRYPHSVAFTPETNHLVVTNAGANYFSVYPPVHHRRGIRWSQTPVLQQIVGPDDIFREVNGSNKMEGGPKGVAIHENNLAICSPEVGVKLYSFREKS